MQTSKGNFEVTLFRAETPLTAGNFVALARRGFYKNQLIHRMVPAAVAGYIEVSGLYRTADRSAPSVRRPSWRR